MKYFKKNPRHHVILPLHALVCISRNKDIFLHIHKAIITSKKKWITIPWCSLTPSPWNRSSPFYRPETLRRQVTRPKVTQLLSAGEGIWTQGIWLGSSPSKSLLLGLSFPLRKVRTNNDCFAASRDNAWVYQVIFASNNNNQNNSEIKQSEESIESQHNCKEIWQFKEMKVCCVPTDMAALACLI